MAVKYKKQANGLYRTRVWDGTYQNGKKHFIYLSSSKSSKDLERKVAEFSISVKDRKVVTHSGKSFIDYARHWEEVYKANKAANTRFMYQNIINKHLACIDCPISDLRRFHYADMMNSIKGKRTKQQAAMTFKQIVKAAIHDKLLPAAALEELTDGYELQKHVAKEKRPLTEAEKKAVFKADLSDRDKAFLYILYGCGVRRGEAAALTVEDFDFKSGTVKIDKAIAYVKYDEILKDTKNYKHRTVPIPKSVLSDIQRYVSTMDGDIFAMAPGKRLTKSSLDKMWKRILRAMQAVSEEPIEGLTPHIFRHNYCTTLCYKIPAVSINDIAYLMGDSKEVVLNVYNHLNMNQEAVSDTISSTF